MLTNDEVLAEKEYLKKVNQILKEEIDTYESRVKALSTNIQEQMSYAWDKTNRLSDTEFIYALANIQKRSVYAENANKKVRFYKKMLNSAYFARIDFEDEEGVIPIYIGISSLEHNDDFYVYDWRAPISSMFYNFETGNASYEISTGEKITGKITLKRQYKISNGEIVDVFDTDMQVIDNVLKSILSQNSSNKMKNIVNTIQKEQNSIIRKNDVDILLVQGPAGSGKTSVALHKIAYLLYSERDKLNNSNLMILSPNEIFNNYISDVLPEIGEDNVAQATFIEFAKAYINEFSISTKIEDIYEVVYGNNFNPKKYNEIQFKYDPIYIKILDDFITENFFEFLDLDDIVINDETIMSKPEMKKIAQSFDISNESLFLSAKKILERIFLTASKKTAKQLTLEKLKNEAISSLSKLKLRAGDFFKLLYKNLNDFKTFVLKEFKKYNYKNNYDLTSIFNITNQNLSNSNLEFQDVAPFMFFKSRIIGISANKNIKYVLIDEAQDYSIVQYKILASLFKNSNITVLGDLNQSILPFFKHESYENIKNILSSQKNNSISEQVNLTRTYRSTYEINQIAKSVLSNNHSYEQIDRHGDKVKIIKQNKFTATQILKHAIELKKSYGTVAIICKNNQETLLYSQQLRDSEDSNKFKILKKTDNLFIEQKIMIVPAYLAKGLEFDAVIVSNATADFYGNNEQNLFYVVLTRALHKLIIYYSGEITPLLSGEINEENIWWFRIWHKLSTALNQSNCFSKQGHWQSRTTNKVLRQGRKPNWNFKKTWKKFKIQTLVVYHFYNPRTYLRCNRL